jgi:hypothetical protein
MVDNDILIHSMNDREKEIDNFVNNFFPNDTINILIKKYSSELKDYKYIDYEAIFSTLKLKGCIRYINKFTKQLRFGGLLIKIFKKNNKWYALLKKFDGEKYRISFNSNYIFYLENNQDKFRHDLEYFIMSVDNNEYDIQ